MLARARPVGRRGMFHRIMTGKSKPMLAKAPRPVLLLTRPAAQSARFADEVTDRIDGLSVLVAPVLDIVRRPLFVQPRDYAGLIFTSENGVDAFAAASRERGHPVWCVGTRTADTAAAAGFHTIRSAATEGGTAESLFSILSGDHPPTPLLHVRGAHARGDLAPRLTAAGIACDAVILYDQQARPLTPEAMAALDGEAAVLIPLFSPRSASLIAENAARAQAPLYPVAISRAAARAWQALRAEAPIVAQRPDGAAMLDALAGIVEGMAARQADGVNQN